ncbi:hypothetical protein [Thermoproteus tenax]|nr:hypothetical protein [Thermoproteus tenax]
MILIDYDPRTGVGLAATGKAACGQIEVRPIKIPPPPISPPLRAGILRSPNGGLALISPAPTSEADLVLENIDYAIEGEIRRGILTGVACGRKIKAKSYVPYEGPLLGLVPVKRLGDFPRAVFRMLIYRLALP